MKRTTIFVDESLERELQAIAAREQRPVASLVREAIAAYVAARPGVQRLSFESAGRSGRSDVASRHEDLLWREPHGSPKRSRPVRQTRRPRR